MGKKSKAQPKIYMGTVVLYLVIFIAASGLFGFLICNISEHLQDIVSGNGMKFDVRTLVQVRTWVTGMITAAVLFVILCVGTGAFGLFTNRMAERILKSSKNGDVSQSVLENSRFMTEKERDGLFPTVDYEDIGAVKKDGVPIRALIDKKGHLKVNFMPGAHALVIGSTGSGKTTTFINPMIQLLAATNCGSSMIMTDPKGELFDLHSEFLRKRGYEVLVLDLRDTYLPSGVVTRDTVCLTVPEGMTVRAYKNGNPISAADGYEFSEKGAYIVMLGETDDCTVEFTILGKTADNLTQYKMPAGFSVDSVTFDGQPITTETSFVDLSRDGDYVIHYSCKTINVEYTLGLHADHTAPTLTLEGLTDGYATGPVRISCEEADAIISVFFNGEEVRYSDELVSSGSYVVTAVDAAGNRATYDFVIRMYFNVNSITFFVLAAAVLGTLAAYILISRKKLKIR